MRTAFVGLLCAALVAASVQMVEAAPPAIYDWTGFYLGGQVGGGWDSNQPTRADNTGAPNFPLGYALNTSHGSGLLGGGYAGFNYQINQFVFGIDGDYFGANLIGKNSDVGLLGPSGGMTSQTDKVEWIATLTGRLGYATNNWMFFGKGGWASAGFSRNGAVFNSAGVMTVTFTNSQTRNGLIIGTGMELAFVRNWSAKLEYDYVNFSTANYNGTKTSVPAGAVSYDAYSATSSLNMVKLGLAYRF